MSKPTLGDQPIEEIYRGQMNALAGMLDGMFNEGRRGPDRQVGFVLMVFEFNDTSGRCNYISNARRQDVVNLLRDQLEKFERNQK